MLFHDELFYSFSDEVARTSYLSITERVKEVGGGGGGWARLTDVLVVSPQASEVL